MYMYYLHIHIFIDVCVYVYTHVDKTHTSLSLSLSSLSSLVQSFLCVTFPQTVLEWDSFELGESTDLGPVLSFLLPLRVRESKGRRLLVQGGPSNLVVWHSSSMTFSRSSRLWVSFGVRGQDLHIGGSGTTHVYPS